MKLTIKHKDNLEISEKEDDNNDLPYPRNKRKRGVHTVGTGLCEYPTVLPQSVSQQTKSFPGLKDKSLADIFGN